jgi:hypothetical protein
MASRRARSTSATTGCSRSAARPEHVLRITAMAVKASRVLAGALAAGGATPLTEADADRIDARLDEHYRRERLERAGDG